MKTIYETSSGASSGWSLKRSKNRSLKKLNKTHTPAAAANHHVKFERFRTSELVEDSSKAIDTADSDMNPNSNIELMRLSFVARTNAYTSAATVNHINEPAIGRNPIAKFSSAVESSYAASNAKRPPKPYEIEMALIARFQTACRLAANNPNASSPVI